MKFFENNESFFSGDKNVCFSKFVVSAWLNFSEHYSAGRNTIFL